MDNYRPQISPYAQFVGNYQTRLPDAQEQQFHSWVNQNQIPFDPGQYADYDMRGFWQAMTRGDQRATSAIDPYDKLPHFPDYWKTPYHESFSNESIYAKPTAPAWQGNRFLVDQQSGAVKFDQGANPYVRQLFMPQR